MGQYFKIVNLTKKEYFSPSILGDGIKFGTLGHGISNVALARLLCSPGMMESTAFHRRFGEKGKDDLYVGHWAGDQIIIPGDYERPDESGDNLYNKVLDDPDFEDIGPKLFR